MESARKLTAGPSIDDASAIVVLVHGRGATADGMLELFAELDLPNVAAIAPQAANFSWYPQSFLAPIETNQPYLDQSLGQLRAIISELPARRTVLLGFSQGACLTLEFAARNPQRYGAVIGLTGGLIGPPGTRFEHSGSFDGTPVFLGTSDPDPHVPFTRVQETEAVMRRMGADVELRRYPGMPHTINEDELDACRRLIQKITAAKD